MVKRPETDARVCAATVMETVPHLMRVLRAQVRSTSNPDLSMPQFRTLAFIGRNPGAMLSDVATFLALTPPAASKLVEGLFQARLIARDAGTEDRRKVALRLTSFGKRKYDAAVLAAESYLAEKLGQLDERTRGEVVRAMAALHTLFEDPPETRRAMPASRAAKT